MDREENAILLFSCLSRDKVTGEADNCQTADVVGGTSFQQWFCRIGSCWVTHHQKNHHQCFRCLNLYEELSQEESRCWQPTVVSCKCSCRKISLDHQTTSSQVGSAVVQWDRYLLAHLGTSSWTIRGRFPHHQPTSSWPDKCSKIPWSRHIAPRELRQQHHMCHIVLIGEDCIIRSSTVGWYYHKIEFECLMTVVLTQRWKIYVIKCYQMFRNISLWLTAFVLWWSPVPADWWCWWGLLPASHTLTALTSSYARHWRKGT